MIALSVMVIDSGQTLAAARGDVAVADAVALAQLGNAVLGVQRIHLQRGGVHEIPRADKAVVHVMIAQHVANVLAEETLDALAEFLRAIDVRPAACARCRRGRPACAA
jgi:hypothetical protein